jgi:hypothetical protein
MNNLGILIIFPSYHTEEFEATIQHLKNLTAVSIDNFKVAVATAKYHSENKTVKQFFKIQKNIRLCENKPVTITDNVFNAVITLSAIQSCYDMLAICFTPPYNIKPLLPTYKQRESTKSSSEHRQQGTDFEMAPIRHKKEVKVTIQQKQTSMEETPINGASYHAMKF